MSRPVDPPARQPAGQPHRDPASAGEPAGTWESPVAPAAGGQPMAPAAGGQPVDPGRSGPVSDPSSASAGPSSGVTPAASTEPSTPVEPAGRTEPAPGFDERGRVRTGRVSRVWVGLIATAVFLILLIIFIAQNSRRVPLRFFGWHGQFSLALTILLSAVIGVLLVAIPGSVRIFQLRRALRKNGPGNA